MSGENQKGFKAAIIGATGATGREIVRTLSEDPRVENITVIVRRELEEWQTNAKIRSKLKIIKLDNYDNISNLKSELSGYDTFYNALGSQTGRGTEEFVKVDYNYSVESAKLAKEANIPHYSNVGTVGAKSNAWLLYFRTKGQAEEEMEKLGFDYLALNRPGMLKERENDQRTKEKVLSYFSWIIGGIHVRELGKALAKDALDFHAMRQKDSQYKKGNVVLGNADLLKLSKN